MSGGRGPRGEGGPSRAEQPLAGGGFSLCTTVGIPHLTLSEWVSFSQHLVKLKQLFFSVLQGRSRVRGAAVGLVQSPVENGRDHGRGKTHRAPLQSPFFPFIARGMKKTSGQPICPAAHPRRTRAAPRLKQAGPRSGVCGVCSGDLGTRAGSLPFSVGQ